ncbi:hypothetical protein PoB_000807800 [Plakobranchus ocellatus]|uniref:Uncharacterized protein n=1 Tax=Plakobranchus ocellatus TaxID=259542 RepID=A0AAV3YGC5_9GAST|nr:hypothetical protein PoB_000807800 [Plakobranchus ocellatus]
MNRHFTTPFFSQANCSPDHQQAADDSNAEDKQPIWPSNSVVWFQRLAGHAMNSGPPKDMNHRIPGG